MTYTLDLHTHAYDSPDGSLGLNDYKKMLEHGPLSYIAITSHDSVRAAQEIQAALGDHIIVGEEITAQEGEIIGLYLTQEVPNGMTAAQTVHAIKQQGGVVYIPHPFETARKGLKAHTLQHIAKDIDIIEAHNGRAVFQNRSAQAKEWALTHHKAMAASSDAHGWHGWGKTHTTIAEAPTRQNIVELLQSATYTVKSPGLRGLLYPKFNRLRHK